MAVITGDTGSVTFASGYTTNVRNWTISVVADEHDITDFDSTAWAEYMTGIKRWSGSYECFLDGTTTLPKDGSNYWDAVNGAATFTASTSRTFAGTIHITGNDVTVNPADPNSVTVNFRGSGALTLA